MVFQCINIRQVPKEVLKTATSGLGFQHLPRDLANVNAWKTIFDLYSMTILTFSTLAVFMLLGVLVCVSTYFTILQIIFHFLWDQLVHCGIFENGVLFMYTLEGVSSVAIITAYEESQ